MTSGPWSGSSSPTTMSVSPSAARNRSRSAWVGKAASSDAFTLIGRPSSLPSSFSTRMCFLSLHGTISMYPRPSSVPSPTIFCNSSSEKVLPEAGETSSSLPSDRRISAIFLKSFPCYSHNRFTYGCVSDSIPLSQGGKSPTLQSKFPRLLYLCKGQLCGIILLSRDGGKPLPFPHLTHSFS